MLLSPFTYHICHLFPFLCNNHSFPLQHHINIQLKPHKQQSLLSSMPQIQLTAQTSKWLLSLNLLENPSPTLNNTFVLVYNDQIYLENGYLVAQILRKVLKNAGKTSQGLVRVRKIAHIASNQNWRIVKDIMEELEYDHEIDPENVDHQTMQDIVQFLFMKFGPKKAKTRQLKATTLDLTAFDPTKPLAQSRNILQFLILSLSQSFNISLPQTLGLLLNKAQYLIQSLILGTSSSSFTPCITFLHTLLHNLPHLTSLLQLEYYGEQQFISIIVYGLLSHSEEVCQLVCTLLENVESQCVQEMKNIRVMIRTQWKEGFQFVMRRLGENGRKSVFTRQWMDRLVQGQNKSTQKMQVFTKLIKHYHSSLLGKQALNLLQLGYYISSAFQLFQPDRPNPSTLSQRLSARILLSSITRYFHQKIPYNDFTKIIYIFSEQTIDKKCQKNMMEYLTTLAVLFQVVYEIGEKDKEKMDMLVKVALKYYERGNEEVRNFVIQNLRQLINNKPEIFPVSQFLKLYKVAPLQSNQFSLFHSISQLKTLSFVQSQTLLKLFTIFYFNQLHSGCILPLLSSLINTHNPQKWAEELSSQLLTKWPSMTIPPYQLPPNHQKNKNNRIKIKYRSVGIKKKQMLQFTEINRYKNILLILVQINHRQFLNNYSKKISITISKVQKSKVKEMVNTKKWLNNLLALIDAKIIEIRQRPVILTKQNSQTPFGKYEKERSVQEIEQSQEEENQSEGDDGQHQNQFIGAHQHFRYKGQPLTQRQINPLLPYTEQDEPQPYQPLLISSPLYFQTYEQNYLRLLALSHTRLLTLLTSKYLTSASIPHFLSKINILSYLSEQHLNSLQELDQKMNVNQDEPRKKVSQLIVQAAFMVFQFKKERRIDVKCVESVYQLLQEKNAQDLGQAGKEEKQQKPSMQTKIQFDYQILPSIKRTNPHVPSAYISCFQILSQVLFKAINIHQIEPVSKIVTQISQTATPTVLTSPSKSNLEQSLVISENQFRQMKILEKILAQEEDKSRLTPTLAKSVMIKKKKDSKDSKDEEARAARMSQSKVVTERWADVQKKIMRRRRELQAREQQP